MSPPVRLFDPGAAHIHIVAENTIDVPITIAAMSSDGGSVVIINGVAVRLRAEILGWVDNLEPEVDPASSQTGDPNVIKFGDRTVGRRWSGDLTVEIDGEWSTQALSKWLYQSVRNRCAGTITIKHNDVVIATLSPGEMLPPSFNGGT